MAQAGPRDPDAFPFIVLGNKVDKKSDRRVGMIADEASSRGFFDLVAAWLFVVLMLFSLCS